MAEATKKKAAIAKAAAHDHDDHAHGPGEVHAHIGSYKSYGAIFLALIFFTVVTVAISYVHLGKANLLVAVVIASIKASLVCAFFMHLKDDTKFHTLIVIASVTFIGVFFALTMNDVGWRERLEPQAGARHELRSGDPAPGIWENPVPREHEEKAGAEGEAAPKASGAASAAPAASGEHH